MRLSAVLGLCTALSPATVGAQVTLSLPIGRGLAADIIPATYDCAGTAVAVQYVTAGANHLALIPLDGQDLVFVGVIAASGARYVSGVHEWWVKGDGATLRDLTRDDGGTVCTAAG